MVLSRARLAAPWRRGPQGGAPPGEVEQAPRVLVLEQGQTPSGDYLLMPWLAPRARQLCRVDARLPPPAGCLQAGDFVVVSRYLPPAWRRLLDGRLSSLSGLAWFLDDDLLDPQALAELPRDYARKLKQLALDLRPWFDQAGAQRWYATEALARRYPEPAGRVLPLAPGAGLRPPAAGRPAPADGLVRIVYHGSASHARELAWLLPILREVQQQCAHTHLSLIGDLSVNRLFRDLPRTSIVHPMAWPNYLAYTQATVADIGLAPLLPSRFNAGRGAVKFFDHARMGAFGVYSDLASYAGWVRPEVDGVLLPNEPERWVARLVALAQAPDERLALAQAAVQRARG